MFFRFPTHQRLNIFANILRKSGLIHPLTFSPSLSALLCFYSFITSPVLGESHTAVWCDRRSGPVESSPQCTLFLFVLFLRFSHFRQINNHLLHFQKCNVQKKTHLFCTLSVTHTPSSTSFPIISVYSSLEQLATVTQRLLCRTAEEGKVV